jgi:hypothetical protein
MRETPVHATFLEVRPELETYLVVEPGSGGNQRRSDYFRRRHATAKNPIVISAKLAGSGAGE